MKAFRGLCIVFCLTSGCSVTEPPSEHLERAAAPVLMGTTDSGDTGVVAVENAVELCSGFEIAPDLVLTARHCVGPLVNPTSPCVATNGGASVMPGASYAPTTFSVFTGTDASGAKIAVAEIILPSDSTELCGNDLALLRLATALDASVALAPRIDAPPTVGETVTAIGYGASQGGIDTTSGTRRTLGGLSVTAVGPSLPRYVDGEWTISAGPCAGDSGSPAVSATGEAVGVMSRGNKATCTDMIYERVDTHATWLRDQARASYQRAGIAVPAWIDPPGAGGAGGGGATSSSTGAMSSHPKTNPQSGSCSFQPAATSIDARTSCAPLVVFVTAFYVARRRRSPKSQSKSARDVGCGAWVARAGGHRLSASQVKRISAPRRFSR